MMRGLSKAARLQHPEGVTFTAGMLFVADTYNNNVKAVDTTSLEVRTLTLRGADGGGAVDVSLDEPSGVSAAGGRLYIADRNHHMVRVVDLESHRAATVQLAGVEVRSARQTPDIVPSVALPGQASRPGAGRISVTVSAPDGYRLNSLAPSRLDVRGADSRVVKFEQRSVTWQSEGQRTTADLPVAFMAGRTTLQFGATIYYCRTERTELCLVKQAELEMPVEVAAGSPGAVLHVFYQLPAADIP
jgi:hypothetical protein